MNPIGILPKNKRDVYIVNWLLLSWLDDVFNVK